jgi:ketosteroid isomerase-like protein
MKDLIALTREFYELLLGDFQAAADKYLAEDVAWENPLPDCIPFGGTYRGIAGLAEYLGALDQAITMNPLHFDDILAADRVVAAIGVERDTLVHATGRRYNMPFVHVIRFNDEGKVIHVREYNDTLEMVAAFDAPRTPA